MPANLPLQGDLVTRRLDGLITFFSWHHAIRAEKVLGRHEYAIELIPGPREISPNCGTALRFQFHLETAARELLARERIQIEATHRYVPVIESAEVADSSANQAPGVLPRWVRRWR